MKEPCTENKVEVHFLEEDTSLDTFCNLFTETSNQSKVRWCEVNPYNTAENTVSSLFLLLKELRSKNLISSISENGIRSFIGTNFLEQENETRMYQFKG